MPVSIMDHNNGLFKAQTASTLSDTRVLGHLEGLLCGQMALHAPVTFWAAVAKKKTGPVQQYVDSNSLVMPSVKAPTCAGS